MAATSVPSAPSKARVFARRTISTLILWAVVTAVFVSRQPWAFLALITALALLATREYFGILRNAKVAVFSRWGICVAIAYLLVSAAWIMNGRIPPASLEAIAVWVGFIGAFTLQLRHPIRGLDALTAPALTVLGIIYIPILFHFTTRLLWVDLPPGSALAGPISDHGAYLLLWLAAVTKFTDMGAYLTGSLLGRHKMIPHVSPGKTWEGFAGALVFSQLAGCGFYLACPDTLKILHSWPHVVILGFLLAVLAVIGDLAESVVKRAVNAKDSGHFLPGIGGALDLIDSLCFTAPALYFYLLWLWHV